MSETINGVRSLIAERLNEIDFETTSLERALKSMGEGNRSQSALRRRKSSAKRRPSRQGAPRGQRREQLLAAIGAGPGARPSELAAEIGISPGQVSGLIAKARAEKLIVKRDAGYALKG